MVNFVAPIMRVAHGMGYGATIDGIYYKVKK